MTAADEAQVIDVERVLCRLSELEQGARAFGYTAVTVVVLHLWLRKRHRDQVRLYCVQQELEEGEEDFPMKLGLRY